jgi:hypothetical protein
MGGHTLFDRDLRVPTFGPVVVPGTLPEPAPVHLREPHLGDTPPTTRDNAELRASVMATMHGLDARDRVTAMEVAANPRRDPRAPHPQPHPRNGTMPRVPPPAELPAPTVRPIIPGLNEPEPPEPGEIVGPDGEERVDRDERGVELRRQLGIPERTSGDGALHAIRSGTVLPTVARAAANAVLPQAPRPRPGESPARDPVVDEIEQARFRQNAEAARRAVGGQPAPR